MNIRLPRTKHEQINEMIEKFEKDRTVYFRQVHRMIDLFETIIKTHTTFFLANYFHVNKVSDQVAKMLVQGLHTPSLGMWLTFNEVLFEELAFNEVPKDIYEQIYQLQSSQNQEKLEQIYIKEADVYVFRSEEERGQVRQRLRFLTQTFQAYDKKYGPLKQPITPLMIPSFYKDFRNWHVQMRNKVVAFRNDYAHGATPPEEECRKHIEQFLPLLKKSLQLPWLHHTQIVVFHVEDKQIAVGEKWVDQGDIKADYLKKAETHIPYLLLEDGSLLRLFPTLTYQPINRENAQSLSFFNDLKRYRSRRISYLNYPYAQHIQDETIFAQFKEVFRIDEWRQQLLNEFEDLELRLQENFKGRTKEIEQLHALVERESRGYLLIDGMPGIGKTSLMIHAWQGLDEHYDLLPYFIRRRQYTNASELFDYLNSRLDHFYNSQLPRGNTEEEKSNLFIERLHIASQQLTKANRKLIVVIDGLDEADEDLLSYLPVNSFENILIIYVSRKTAAVMRFINDIPLDLLHRKTLGSIEQRDIRAMLYDVVNKYLITDEYVQAIAEKSGGHPLYVRLLCEALEQYPEKLNDESYLPEKWEQFYERFIDRFVDHEHGKKILEGLFVFAAAKDYLSQTHMSLILRNSLIDNRIIFDHLYELLIESIEHRKHYQLFHETFHEYVATYYKSELIDAEDKIVEFCEKWQEFDRHEPTIFLYSLNHYAYHLKERKDLETLQRLVHHPTFIEKQIEHTNQFTASFSLIQAYRKVANEKNNKHGVIDAMEQVIRLNKQLRQSHRERMLRLKSSSFSSWHKAMKDIYYFTEKERAYIYFNSLSDSILSEDVALIDQVIEVIKSFLPGDATVFNWSQYVPLSLLVNVALRLEELGISSALITNHVLPEERPLLRIVTERPIEVEHISTIKSFIDQFHTYKDHHWFNVMTSYIERLLKEGFLEAAFQYEEEVLEQLPYLENAGLLEKQMADLAVIYARNHYGKRGLTILTQLQGDFVREEAYLEICKLSPEQEVRREAYEYGKQFIAEAAEQFRTSLIVKWLPIMKEMEGDLFHLYNRELFKTANIRSRFLRDPNQEDILLYFWQEGHYETTLSFYRQIEDAFIKYSLLLELYKRREEVHDSSILEQIDREWELMTEALLVKDPMEASRYETQFKYILEQWLERKDYSQIHSLFLFFKNEYFLNGLYVHYLHLLAQKDERKRLIDESILIYNKMDSTSAQTNITKLYMQERLFTQFTQVIEQLAETQSVESFAVESAKIALEKKNDQFYNLLTSYIVSDEEKRKLNLMKQFERCIKEDIITFEQVDVSLDEFTTESPLMEQQIDLALGRRFIHQGKFADGYRLIDQYSNVVTRREIVPDALQFFLGKGKSEEALEVYKQVFGTRFTRKDLDELIHFDRMDMMKSIVRQMSKQGNLKVLDVIEQFYEIVQKQVESIEPYTIVYENLLEYGITEHKTRIVELYEWALNETPLDDDTFEFKPYLNMKIHCDVANALIDMGKKNRGLEILKNVIQCAKEKDHYNETYAVQVFVRLAYECEKQRLFDERAYFTNEYRRLYNRTNLSIIWVEMFNVYVRDRRYNKAIEALGKLDSFLGEKLNELIARLLDDHHYGKALQVYKEFKHRSFNEAWRQKIKVEQKFVHYLFINERFTECKQWLDEVPKGDERVLLYKYLFPVLAPETLDLFLQWISGEQFDTKRQIEEELFIYALTNPTWKRDSMIKMFATFSLDLQLNRLCLYGYKQLIKYFFPIQENLSK